MKSKHIIINIIPLAIWIVYYCSTMSKNNLFLVKTDEWVVLGILMLFTIYNLFSKHIKEILVRNLILTISLACGIFISGQLYLNLCPHMTDEHYAVLSIAGEYIICGVVFTIIACIIKIVIKKTSNRRAEG